MNNINCRYLIGSIIFFILTWYFLQLTKKTVYQYELSMQETDNTKIKVFTERGSIFMDKNLFELHLNKIKKTLINLSQNIDSDTCIKFKKYLDKSNINLTEYIKLNSTNKDKQCNNMSTFIDSSVKERNLLLKKINTGTTTDQNDDDELSNTNKSDILDLTADLDIILFLIKNNNCNRGAIDLTMMDKLIFELYNSNCIKPDKKESFENNSTGCDSVNCYDSDNYYFDKSVNNKLLLTPVPKISYDKTDHSADIIDITNVNMIKESFEKTPTNNMTTESQSNEKDFPCNEVILGKQLKNKSCESGMLEFYRESLIDKKNHINLDINASSSLMNEYDYIIPSY
jgi:hypothetical protein